MKKLAVLTFLALSSCNLVPEQDPDNKGTVDPDCVDPMSMPNGYVFDYTVTDEAGEVVFEQFDFFCFLDKQVNGRAINYCGFVAEVFENHYSFDTTVSAWNGAITSGFGNDEGAEIITSIDGVVVSTIKTTHKEEF